MRLPDPAMQQALETVSRLEHDHEEADRHRKAVDGLARRWLAEGQIAPADNAALREHLAALMELYARHIGIEDRELFPAGKNAVGA